MLFSRNNFMFVNFTLKKFLFHEMMGEGGKGVAGAHPGPPFSTVLGNLIIEKTEIVSLSF